jgi:hypothetical protein
MDANHNGICFEVNAGLINKASKQSPSAEREKEELASDR